MGGKLVCLDIKILGSVVTVRCMLTKLSSPKTILSYTSGFARALPSFHFLIHNGSAPWTKYLITRRLCGILVYMGRQIDICNSFLHLTSFRQCGAKTVGVASCASTVTNTLANSLTIGFTKFNYIFHLSCDRISMSYVSGSNDRFEA